MTTGDNWGPLSVVHSCATWLPVTQTWMYTQLRHLPPERVQNHIVCEETSNLDQFAMPNVHCFGLTSPIKRSWDLGLRKLRLRRHLGYLVSQARQCRANVVHSHFGDTAWADRGAVKRTGARHVVTFYGLDVNKLPTIGPRWRERYAELFESVDRVLCEGPHMAQNVVTLGCPVEKVRVHHLGVSIDQIPYRPRKWRPGTALRVLIAGTFREKKGITYALEALGEIQSQIPLEVTIIGDISQPSEAIYKRKILDTVTQQRLGPRVRMLGYQPYSRFLQEAFQHHLFISPSVTAADGDTEGGAPVSIIEMAASGMAIVSSRHCDIPNVLPSTALLADERDVAGLVGHLLYLVENADGWETMLKEARERVEREFNVRTQALRLADLYEELCR